MRERLASLLLIGLILLFTGGCTRTFQFQVVDAESRQPLDGVIVKYACGPGDPFRQPVPPMFLTKTGPDGAVGTPPLSKQVIHHFRFEKDGYLRASVEVSYSDTVAYLWFGGSIAKDVQRQSTVDIMTIAMPRSLAHPTSSPTE
jgi:hypothetical protein